MITDTAKTHPVMRTIRVAFAESGRTRLWIAAKTGLSDPTVGRILRSPCPRDLAILATLADAWQVEVRIAPGKAGRNPTARLLSEIQEVFHCYHPTYAKLRKATGIEYRGLVRFLRGKSPERVHELDAVVRIAGALGLRIHVTQVTW